MYSSAVVSACVAVEGGADNYRCAVFKTFYCSAGSFGAVVCKLGIRNINVAAVVIYCAALSCAIAVEGGARYIKVGVCAVIDCAAV